MWLEEIHAYIAADSMDAASRVIEGIYDQASQLSRFPRLGHWYRDEAEGEVRVVLYGHYRIAYLLREDEAIDVLGVFHGALDIDRYL